jgi:hypothetical protein
MRLYVYKVSGRSPYALLFLERHARNVDLLSQSKEVAFDFLLRASCTHHASRA